MAMVCIIALVAIHGAATFGQCLARSAAEARGEPHGFRSWSQAAADAAVTAGCAPMTAVLILACCARLQITVGDSGAGAPTWVILIFCVAVIALAGFIACAGALPLFEPLRFRRSSPACSSKEAPRFEPLERNGTTLGALVVLILKLVAMGFLIGAAVFIAFETGTASAPAWEPMARPVSAANRCVLWLALAFFTAQAIAQIAMTLRIFEGPVAMPMFQAASRETMRVAGFAPMLAVLFLGARMRALQLEPDVGLPPDYAQHAFYVCTFGFIAMVVMAAMEALTITAQRRGLLVRTAAEVEEEEDEAKKSSCLILVTRAVVLVWVYVGFFCVVIAIVTMPSAYDNKPVPLNGTMNSVLCLAALFFGAHLLSWCGHLAGDLCPKMVRDGFEGARLASEFCPSLAALFVATRMQALFLTNGQGAPSGWITSCMRLATIGMTVQVAMCPMVPVYVGKIGQGSPENKVMFLATKAVQFLAHLAVGFAVLVVILGALTMTPESANGPGTLTAPTPG